MLRIVGMTIAALGLVTIEVGAADDLPPPRSGHEVFARKTVQFVSDNAFGPPEPVAVLMVKWGAQSMATDVVKSLAPDDAGPWLDRAASLFSSRANIIFNLVLETGVAHAPSPPVSSYSESLPFCRERRAALESDLALLTSRGSDLDFVRTVLVNEGVSVDREIADVRSAISAKLETFNQREKLMQSLETDAKAEVDARVRDRARTIDRWQEVNFRCSEGNSWSNCTVHVHEKQKWRRDGEEAIEHATTRVRQAQDRLRAVEKELNQLNEVLKRERAPLDEKHATLEGRRTELAARIEESDTERQSLERQIDACNQVLAECAVAEIISTEPGNPFAPSGQAGAPRNPFAPSGSALAPRNPF